MLSINQMKKLSAILLFFVAILGYACANDADLSPGIDIPGGGKGGSMARFAIVGNNLYTVDQTSLQHFDISNPADPVVGKKTNIDLGIETIFPYKGNLFIGAMDGMHILSISDPTSPKYMSKFEHVRACDPVVVQDTIAYVTLRSGGNECWTPENSLNVLNVKNLSNPQLLDVYPMSNPHGLGVSGERLYVCEGDFGMKVFDISDPYNLVMTRHIKNVHGFDVIPYYNVLILIGNDGLYQYDIDNSSDPDELNLLSVIPVVK
jgi:hypothetical protein